MNIFVILLSDIASFSHCFILSLSTQPDSPSEFGNKIYEMMAMALGGRWGRSEEADEAEATGNAETDENSADGEETQVIEPSEVRTESDPWSE